MLRSDTVAFLEKQVDSPDDKIDYREFAISGMYDFIYIMLMIHVRKGINYRAKGWQAVTTCS